MITNRCETNSIGRIKIFSWNVGSERHKKRNQYYDEDNESFNERMDHATAFIRGMLTIYDILILQEVHEKIIDKLHLTNHNLFTSAHIDIVDSEINKKYKKYMVTIIDKKIFSSFIINKNIIFDSKRMISLKINIDGNESIVLLNVHIAIARETQIKQLNELKNIIYDNPTVVICGDFNVNSRDFFHSINRKKKSILHIKGNTLTGFRFLNEEKQGLRKETVYGPCDNIMIFSNTKSHIEPIEITNDQYFSNRGMCSDHLCLSCNIFFDFECMTHNINKKRGRLQNNYNII